jgi:small-conductance mechanosensitive channel
MATRRAVVYFGDKDEEEKVRSVMGKAARYYAGLAEGELDPAQFRQLLDAGIAVEPAVTRGPGTQPTLERTAALEDASEIDRVSAVPAVSERAPAASGPSALALLIRALLGGLLSAVGVLILLQQLNAIDPTPATAIIGLTAAALFAIALTVLALTRRTSAR